jgi:hypothetical protein
VHSRRIDPIILFDDAVLPGRPGRDGLVTDAHCSRSTPLGGAVDLISIADQITWSFIPGKCLRDLMYDPLGGQMRCYVDPDKISARGPDNDESVEQLESDARNHEEVHGGDLRRVVAKEGKASLAKGRRVA